ncbi:unnamed protein product [Rotaria sp. Silwood1]|nr:unnamed protein product [Rotaria sp. Silwood1]
MVLGHSSEAIETLWKSNFTLSNWLAYWNQTRVSYGEENIEIIKNNGTPFIRVHFPKGSWSPQATERAGLPQGGTQWKSNLLHPELSDVTLTYSIRFPSQFNFVRGGKLPGLYGGKGNSGDDTPNGEDGFSARYMWREKGRGILYPFLPDSPYMGTTYELGTPLFNGDNKWHTLAQRLQLNTPGKKDGIITVWYDGKEVFKTTDVLFRTVYTLKITGIFFQTFFGGSTADWATPVATYIDFKDFKLTH